MEDSPEAATEESVMSDIDRTEEILNSFFYRLESLQKSLKYKPMTNDERENTEKEIAELKKVLLKQEQHLQSLRKSNRGTAFISVIIITIAFLLFGLYKMYTNTPVPLKEATLKF